MPWYIVYLRCEGYSALKRSMVWAVGGGGGHMNIRPIEGFCDGSSLIKSINVVDMDILALSMALATFNVLVQSVRSNLVLVC